MTKLRSGQALVEFVLVLPILLTLLFGIITFGLYINANITLEDAARIGARGAFIGRHIGSSTQPPVPSTVYGLVETQVANGFGMSSNAVQVTEQSDGTMGGYAMVTVDVSYPYHPLISFPGLLPSTITLHQSYTVLTQAQPSSSSSSST